MQPKSRSRSPGTTAGTTCRSAFASKRSIGSRTSSRRKRRVPCLTLSPRCLRRENERPAHGGRAHEYHKLVRPIRLQRPAITVSLSERQVFDSPFGEKLLNHGQAAIDVWASGRSGEADLRLFARDAVPAITPPV